MLEQKIIIVFLFIAIMVLIAIMVRSIASLKKSNHSDKTPTGNKLRMHSKLTLEPGVNVYAIEYGSQQIIINVSKGKAVTSSLTQIVPIDTRLQLPADLDKAI